MPEIAVLSDFPELISFQDKKLHNSKGAAVKYRDNWGIYFIDGKSVDKKVITPLYRALHG